MKVYVAHSRMMDYENLLYKPIREDEELKEHQVILPHEVSKHSSNTREFYQGLDVMIADVSAPATGLGIELGWAYDDGIPIHCIFHKGSKLSGSLKAVTDEFYEYDSPEELLIVIKRIIEKGKKKYPKR